VAGVYLYGTFEHTIDGRGRLAIPARYRYAFIDGKDSDNNDIVRGVIRIGPEGCIELYPQPSFNDEVARRLGSANGNSTAAARRIRRSFLPEAHPVDFDSQNRLVLPPRYREEAGLETEPDADGNPPKVMITGVGDYLELWHPDRWAEEQERVRAAELDEDEDA
jgi:MraZ protein